MVPPGKRGVQVKKDGFRAFGDEVSLASGERKLMTVRLEPAQPPSPSAGKTISPAPAKPPDLLVAPFDKVAAKKGQDALGRALGIESRNHEYRRDADDTGSTGPL